MSEEHTLSGIRVLIVEDEYLIALDVCEWLKRSGASVIGPARSVTHALRLLASSQVDVAVIDVNLGEGPNFEVPEHLTRARVPFLFATGYDELAIPPRFADVPRMEKPYGQVQLVAAVCKLARHVLTDCTN
jgi:two-component SAPR family response regulator